MVCMCSVYVCTSAGVSECGCLCVRRRVHVWVGMHAHLYCVHTYRITLVVMLLHTTTDVFCFLVTAEGRNHKRHKTK